MNYIPYFMMSTLALPAALVIMRLLSPVAFRRLALCVIPNLKNELSAQNQLIQSILLSKKQSDDRVNFTLKLITSLGYTLHHMDDSPFGSLPVNHFWKMLYFGVIGNFLHHVHDTNRGNEPGYLLDKPLSHWLDNSDHNYDTVNLTINQLAKLIPGLEKCTLYDVIDLLYGLIHGNTEADFDAYLKKYIGLRLPGNLMDLATESVRWR